MEDGGWSNIVLYSMLPETIVTNIGHWIWYCEHGNFRCYIRLQPSRWQEMRKMICDIWVDNFMFNPIYFSITWLILNLIFSLFPSTTAKTCSSGLVVFGSSGRKRLSDVILKTEIIIINYSWIENACHDSKPRRHTMPDNNAQVQREGGEDLWK